MAQTYQTCSSYIEGKLKHQWVLCPYVSICVALFLLTRICVIPKGFLVHCSYLVLLAVKLWSKFHSSHCHGFKTLQLDIFHTCLMPTFLKTQLFQFVGFWICTILWTTILQTKPDLKYTTDIYIFSLPKWI